jgi:Ubiquitin-2 like Rad60 SUMO-like
VRLICMGKGILTPDSRTLEDCQVPVFQTHPTPINVSVRPKTSEVEATKGSKEKANGAGGASSPGGSSGRTTEQTAQGCGCVIQ